MAYPSQGGAPTSYHAASPYSTDSFAPNPPPPPPPKPTPHAMPPPPPPHPQSSAALAYSQQEQQQLQQQQQQSSRGYGMTAGRYSSPAVDPSAYHPPPALPQQVQEQQQWHQGRNTASQQPQGEDYGQTHMSIQLPEEGWIPEVLLQKSQPDLQHALTHPEILNAVLHSTSSTPHALTASTAPLQSLLDTNVALAQRVQALYSTLISQREGTSAHLVAVRALEHQWKRKQAELERRLEPWGPRELHQRLGASIIDAERMCKVVEESFLEDATRADGEVASEREVSEWVKRVREGRRLVALRTERRARWDEGRVGGWR